VSRHILGNRSLTHIDAELEKFAVDPRRTPERVGEAHVADQLTDFERDLRSAAARARLPSSKQAKPGPMPADDRLRLDDCQGAQNTRRESIETGKDKTIESVEGDLLWRFSSQHIKLVAQRQDLRLERSA
jgi:hypothetical protein